MAATPSIQEFDPRAIPWQYGLIHDVRRKFDYSSGFHDVLLSGTVGSAKSLVGVHLGLTHCLQNPGAVLCIARRSMPDLRDTIYALMLEHIGEDLVLNRDYWVNETRCQIFFKNGSKIIARSWGDKKAKKARSLNISMLLIEELTENESEADIQAIEELKMRLGRVQGIKENLCIAMTNPDSPAHWAYKYYFESDNPHRHVYLSKLDDNPFLPSWYKASLLRNLDPKTAKRMVEGLWIEIKGETIYHTYDRAVNFRRETYKIDLTYPIRVAFDFNIGEGKPLSLILFQFIGGIFHFFDEVIVHNTITEDACRELAERGLLDHNTKYIIHGDATGKARSPAAKHSNYEIIRQFFSNYEVPVPGEAPRRVVFEQIVPASNPPIRKRHQMVNGVFKNALGEVRAYVYQECKTADEGFRLTKLKKGGQYVEDDEPAYQHVTTAGGYGICSTLANENRQKQHTKEL